MNAEPLLGCIAAALYRVRLEAVLIGNAAAALHGAPVTTMDFDFMFRRSPANVHKLKEFAGLLLDAVILRPYYPTSDLYRVVSDEMGLQVDFLPTVHGIRSFESLRSRAVFVTVGGNTIQVAALEDIVRSKRAAGRPKDNAVLTILDATLHAHTQAGHHSGSTTRGNKGGK